VKSAAALKQGASLRVRLPETAVGEVVLALRRGISSDTLNVDASALRIFDATLVATLASWRLESETAGARFDLLLPTDSSTRRRLQQALGDADDPRRLSVLPTMPVVSEGDVKRVAAMVGARLDGRVPERVANAATLAAAALADNALTHARRCFAVAAVRLTESELTVCVHDRGKDGLSPEAARLELIERIQFPLERESRQADDGVGIAWVQHLIDRDSLDAELLFASGSGRLHLRPRAVFCEAGQAVTGFTAVARFAP
jgi:anti-sigma regulatory factor (Ser/Thr protein kinase)